ncbi:LysR family transcriptional regulator [Nocardia sp. CDC153]|uniref:LysR family transcriptional regulator n=1 Tax=Nocardia sp. CDC153 TaxID=3112167 RepID=UPI002DBB2543|nr:LysR family transcriptional regulator [Nocardia sp. CDC153]MEC3953152.1 LysR family transcriptional regulator [Nocardia sp. CDC153]
MLEVRQLKIFQAVARTGSYSAAARHLGYTQPAISQQVKAMERQLGTALVTRSGHQLQLTEAGEALRRHAATVLGSLDAAEAEIRALTELKAGTVRLAAFPSAMSTLVPKTIARVRAAEPELRIALVEAEPPEAVAMLRAGECEIALLFDYPEGGVPDSESSCDAASPDLSELSVRPLFTDRLRVLLPLGHELAGGYRMSPLQLSELAHEKWIAGCPQCRGYLIDACGEAGFHPDISFATENLGAVVGLVAEGLGVALATELAIAGIPAVGAVRSVAVEPAMQRRILAVTLPKLEKVPAVRAVIEELQATVPLVETAVTG